METLYCEICSMCRICSKLTVMIPERRHQLLTDFTHYSSVSIVDFELVSAGWEEIKALQSWS